MGYPNARFVVFYEDGTQLIEDRSNPRTWNDAPKEGIWDMGILFDPQPLYFPHAKDKNDNPIPITDPLSGVHLNERCPVQKLKGRRFIHVGWFRMVDFVRNFGLATGKKTEKYLSLMIGYVYNPEGDCVIMFGKEPIPTIVAFQHNIFDLHADDNSIMAMQIDLEKCGTARETRQVMIKPEVIAEST